MANALRRPLLVLGLLLAILGTAGVLFPNIMSIAVEIYLGWLMVLAGALWRYYAFRLHVHWFSGWLKPVVLIAAGILWLLFNGVLSPVLALVILVGWPATSPIFLGLFVGISLLFDGLSLMMIGVSLKKE